MNPGIYYNIPFSEYLKIDAVSSSYLRKLAECPAAGKVPTEETEDMIFGRALHTLVLEGPTQFLQGFCAAPEGDKRKTEVKAAYEAFLADNAGKQILSSKNFVKAHDMKKAISSHPLANAILKSGQPEITLVWKDEETGLLCKARLDWLTSNYLAMVDLKSCKDASKRGFKSAAYTHGYHIQQAMYTEGYNILKQVDEAADFLFIASQKTDPHRVEVYYLPEDMKIEGQTKYRELLHIEAECRHYNFWPNYSSNTAIEL